MSDVRKFPQEYMGEVWHEQYRVVVHEEYTYSLSTPKGVEPVRHNIVEEEMKRSIAHKIFDHFRKFLEGKVPKDQELYSLGAVVYTYRSRPYPWNDNQITGYAKVYRRLP